MTQTYRCNECRKDCGTRAKVEAGHGGRTFYHFCSYRCAKLYYEKQEMVHEEQDEEVKRAYWREHGRDYVAGR